MIPRQFRATALATLIACATGGAALAQGGAAAVTSVVEAWLASPHADSSAEAFRHWDEDGEVPGSCATCHSGLGFTSFLRSERATPGVIDHPVPLGATVDCAACHNSAAAALDSVRFPSGAEVAGLGPSAICATCHQGRASTASVVAATEGMDDDAVSPDLGFINVHYKAAAATLMGSQAQGGYQYPGKTYLGRFAHVAPLDTCTGCHQPHTLEVNLESCTSCHKGATEFTAIRMRPADADGDGDTAEGVAFELSGLTERLDAAIAAYAAEVAGTPIGYSPAAYPYFFADTDGDGALSAEEASYPNRYQSWTPRLLRAAYNYQYALKDTGAFTHNPHYVVQLLHDSLESLSEATDVDMSGLVRP